MYEKYKEAVIDQHRLKDVPRSNECIKITVMYHLLIFFQGEYFMLDLWKMKDWCLTVYQYYSGTAYMEFDNFKIMKQSVNQCR